MIKNLLLSTLLCSTFGLAVACGGDTGDGGGSEGGGEAGASNDGQGGAPGDGSTPPAVDFGVPAAKKLSELTPAETAQLCEEAEALVDTSGLQKDMKEFTCKLAGITATMMAEGDSDADLQKACKAAYDECMAEPADDEPAESCEFEETTCSATVGELESCMNDSLEMIGEIKSKLPSCDKVTKESVGDVMGDLFTLEPSESCKALEKDGCDSLDTPVETPDSDM
jgi:hypothetical protein